METKNLLTRSIEEISSKELSQLHSAIIDELDNRNLRAKKAAWDKLVVAFKEYVVGFGSVEIATDDDIFYVDSLSDFSSIGRIDFNFDE